MKRLPFLSSIMFMLLVSGMIASPAWADTIGVLGSWGTGTSHTKESGTNRTLILIAHAEDNGIVSLNSVTYGGRPMTKVKDQIVASSSYDAYVAAYILDEAGVAAAASGTFSPSWSVTADNVSYSSVFLSNVDQTTLIGASASNGSTSGTTITTSALTTNNGDMVILGATCGNASNYTVNNGFTEGPENDMSSSTGTVGYKSATGASETPSVTNSNVNRQVLIGFVVKANSGGPTLSVSPTSLSLAAAAGSSGTFNITSNTSWSVSDDQTWLSASPTSGSNNGTVTVTAQENTSDLARTGTVTVSGTGVSSQTVTVTQSGVGIGCDVPPMPSFSSLPNIAKLPNPFTFMDGDPVTTAGDWICRRAEIAELIQEFESGYKPDTPYSATTASYNGSTLAVTVNDNGHQISFNCSVSKPSGSGPFPVLLTVGGSSLGSISGVATVNIPNDTIAQQNNSSSRGQGLFYNMYGSNHSASAMMAWAWAASRVIDAIEKTASTSNLDPTRIAVTGCSRNGKGALMCGAFDDRIDLTIPQESGSGGSGSWRVSCYMKNTLGQDTQALCEICGENVWFRANFNQFCGNENKLPTDHHELIGLIAPRAVYIIDNNILWLGPESSWNCANAAKEIWIALGVPDKFGYSCTTEHGHCSFPSSQRNELNAYVGKYLVGGGSGTTGIMRNDNNFNYDKARWVDWSTPTLH
jgi:hypothetical protein